MFSHLTNYGPLFGKAFGLGLLFNVRFATFIRFFLLKKEDTRYTQ